MSLHDLWRFLCPDYTEWVQLIFFCIIVLLPVGSGLWMLRKGNERVWQTAWENQTRDHQKDDLDIEHGSIKDLSEAVATSAERLAEIIPGILLVVGLLGTFIGIGVALDNAAAILSRAQDTAGAASAMNEMLGMLKGLGTKFKTSTWGIIGYLLFKAWYSWYNKEEERLRWCIMQSNKQLRQRRADAEKHEAQKQQAILTAIGNVGAGIRNTLQHEISQNREVLSQEVENTSLMGEKLTDVTTAIANFIEASQKSAENLAKASDKIADSATALEGAVGTFSDRVGTTLEEVTTKLNNTVTDMTGGFTKTMEAGAGQLKGAIDESGKLLQDATGGILEAVGGMSTTLNGMLSDIRDSLVSTMGGASKHLQESMTSSGDQLQKATSAIHGAVEQMSEDVTSAQKALQGTLTIVGTTLKESEERQRKMQHTLEHSAQALKSESKEVMTAVCHVIQKLEEQLSTVSSGNLEMTAVVKALNEAMRVNNSILQEFFPPTHEQLSVIPRI